MATRRDFIRGAMAASGGLISNISLAQGGAVKLILVREAGYQNKCVSCIQGKLYGVPAAIDLNGAEKLTSMLSFLCDAVELSYEENKPGRSSIPEGSYSAKVRNEGTKKWMWSEREIGKGTLLPNRAWRLELQDVPNKRTNVQFHYGQDVSWSTGCIIIGHKLAQCSAVGDCRFPDSPEPAVAAVRNYVQSAGLNSATPIAIRIASA